MKTSAKTQLSYVRTALFFSLLHISFISQANQWQQPTVAAEQQSAAAQQTINKLDEETQANIQLYQSLLYEIRKQEKYNENLKQMVAEQQLKKESIEQRLKVIQATEKELTPLVMDLYQGLQQFILADTNLLDQERRTRLQELAIIVNDNQQSLQQKYRALLSAYSIEVGYSKMLLTWYGDIQLANQTLNVQFLAVGRLGSYFLTLDQQQGGYWQRDTQQWITLTEQQRHGVANAIAVATHQLPDQVVAVPLAWEVQ